MLFSPKPPTPLALKGQGGLTHFPQPPFLLARVLLRYATQKPSPYTVTCPAAYGDGK